MDAFALVPDALGREVSSCVTAPGLLVFSLLVPPSTAEEDARLRVLRVRVLLQVLSLLGLSEGAMVNTT